VLAAAAAVGVLVAVPGCASGNPAVSHGSAAPLQSAPPPEAVRPCVDPHPAVPPPVSPAVPGVQPNGELASVWTLDGGQLTVAPATGEQPVVDHAQALCTLLAALGINHFGVLDFGSGLTLLLGKVTIADQLVRSAVDVGGAQVGVQPPPPPTPFHSRLSWVAVIDPAIPSSCPTTPPASSSPEASVVAVPRIVPYQALVLDAMTAKDGIVYEARTNANCQPNLTFGPSVAALLVNVSVPWRLLSRDPGGLFGTIAVSVTACDSYGSGANSSRTQEGLVEFDVWRPIADCGAPTEKDQILRGPTVSDPLPMTLTHAAIGDVDVTPEAGPSREVAASSLLCEQAAQPAEPLAATYPTTVAQLRQLHGGPAPGIYPFAKSLSSFAADAPAAWCEFKTAAGYTITAVSPNGSPLDGDTMTTPTFVDLQNGPPALP
jgi:hypothetical protein